MTRVLCLPCNEFKNVWSCTGVKKRAKPTLKITTAWMILLMIVQAMSQRIKHLYKLVKHQRHIKPSLKLLQHHVLFHLIHSAGDWFCWKVSCGVCCLVSLCMLSLGWCSWCPLGSTSCTSPWGAARGSHGGKVLTPSLIKTLKKLKELFQPSSLSGKSDTDQRQSDSQMLLIHYVHMS